MNIEDLLKIISGKMLTGNTPVLKMKVENIYICDLLSWVMSHAKKGDAWITVLTNVNVPAVALLTEVSCVIIPEDIEVEEFTLQKARENGIVIIGSGMNSFEISRRAVESGLFERKEN
ncbi:MAG: hypothetical protein K0R50_1365 [Eubacterium sp.]|jgi:hypothetical protein|nr:hypothetical protein [Eubacterium sp.]